MSEHDKTEDPESRPCGGVQRREFLLSASHVAMGGGLCLAYGSLGAMAVRFLYPSRPRNSQWMFVADLASVKPGDSVSFKTPAGERIAITRHGSSGTESDFIALSSVCPHLGCQVHWEPHNSRFYCPCHNGVFDPAGKAISGPPAEAGQSLPSYPLRVENGILFIEAPLEKLTLG